MTNDDDDFKIEEENHEFENIKALMDEIMSDPVLLMVSEDALSSKILLLLLKERRALWISRIAELLTADYEAVYKKVKLLLSLGLLKRLQPNENNPPELITRSISDAHAHGMRDINDFSRATWVALNTRDLGGKRSNDWWIMFLGLLEDKYNFL